MADRPERVSAEGTGADAWAEEVIRVDPAGNVYVRLSRNGRSLLLQLSPRGTQPRVLSRTGMGDVSYNEVRGMSEHEAVALARAYAARLGEGRSTIAGDFPHLTAGGAAQSAVLPAAHETRRRTAIDGLDPEVHRFSLVGSGYTAVRGAFSADELAALRAEVETALAAMRTVVQAGRELAYTFYDRDTYLGTRCMYCWGDACLGLLDNQLIERLSDAVIGPHKLFDMTSHSALPATRFPRERTETWHRDIDVFDDSPASVRYLWFFVYLDDFTADNGAPWIVPGSQRIPNDRVPNARGGVDRFPTKVQLLGAAGDVVVINPSALHTVGHNITNRPRRMMNVSVCHTDVRPLLDHWAIAGPAIQPRANERLRRMLGAEPEWSLDGTWSLLPEGWQTAPRDGGRAVDPAARVFPREQQGFQRSHRLR